MHLLWPSVPVGLKGNTEDFTKEPSSISSLAGFPQVKERTSHVKTRPVWGRKVSKQYWAPGES